METTYDGEEVNDDLPIIVTGSCSSRAADAVITVAAEFIDQPPITESTANVYTVDIVTAAETRLHDSPSTNRTAAAA